MSETAGSGTARVVPPRRPIKGLRWYIGGLFFLSTVVNYIDRQTLSVLAPHLKSEFAWTNADFALIVISFRAAYAIGQSGAGRMLDRVGTRTGLSLGVAFYSVSAMITSLATGLRSFCFFRFLLGAGEAANWPGATKGVSEWFPRRESGWAVALFDSGSSIGGALAPLIVLWIYHVFGSWRPAFVITGTLGFVWLIAFRWLYEAPETHPRLSPEERAYILSERSTPDEAPSAAGRLPVRTLLALPQTWGVILAKALTDPIWFFITDWFAIYLVSRGFRLEDSLVAFWVPFLAADAGNFLAGGASSALIARGWAVGTARKAVIVLCAAGMTGIAAAVWLTSLWWLTACFAISTLSYAALSTMVLNLPADIYPSHSVASVSGMSGTGAGIGTIAATYITGVVADRYSFAPVLIAASLIPIVAAALVLALVRNTAASGKVINRI
jgi:MFS transporter, ACS family, hexuronate transporter